MVATVARQQMISVLMIASLILRGVYVVLPGLSLGILLVKGCNRLKRTVILAWISGSILAGAVLLAYVTATGGVISPVQTGLALYWGISLMLFLKGVDWILKWGVQKLTPRTATRYPWIGILGMNGIRVLLFTCFALPWVMGGVMVYRPKVHTTESLESMLNLSHETIRFHTPDGIGIAGWWIPASFSSSTTVLFCHGLGASKASAWQMLQKLHAAGVNVLTIDLRAHGFSGGQLCTFGASEWQDVLGAVDYLKTHLPKESDRLIAVGASMGGAAVIKAAERDPRIDGVVVLGSFDSLADVSRDVSDRHMIFPLNLLARYVAFPMACLHTGYNLFEVDPGNRIQNVWPRPVMVIHGAYDEIIPFEHGRKLYEKAVVPRWYKFTGGTHHGILEDPDVIQALLDFVLNAQPNPVVQTDTVCREPAEG